MIKDTKSLYFIIDESIERDLKNEDAKQIRIKFYLKREHQGGYVLVDTESGNINCSIKCIFSQEGLKEYLAGVPSYIDYDSFENCQILLKNYRFDYLISKNNENTLIYKLVCFIENFEVDATYKLEAENIPKNINVDDVIRHKIESFVNDFLKKSHKNLEVDSGNNIFIFNAKNFIQRSFYQAESEQIYNSHLKAFDILKHSKNIEGDNLLIKTGISLNDSFSYLHDFEEELNIYNYIKNFDFTPVYSLCPTQLDKVRGEEFKASDVDINVASQEIIVRPSDLNFEVDLSQEKIKDFLLKKVKRQRPVKEFDKLPENIRNIISSYGDVCSNITNETFDNYLFYRKFLEFEKRSERMDLV